MNSQLQDQAGGRTCPFEGRSHGGALGPVWHASDTSICDSIRILVSGYFEKRVWVIFEY